MATLDGLNKVLQQHLANIPIGMAGSAVPTTTYTSPQPTPLPPLGPSLLLQELRELKATVQAQPLVNISAQSSLDEQRNAHWRKEAEFDEWVMPLYLYLENIDWTKVLELHAIHWQQQFIRSLHYAKNEWGYRRAGMYRNPVTGGGRWIQRDRLLPGTTHRLIPVHPVPAPAILAQHRVRESYIYFKQALNRSLELKRTATADNRRFLAHALRSASIYLGRYDNNSRPFQNKVWEPEWTLRKAIESEHAQRHGWASPSDVGELLAKVAYFWQCLRAFETAEHGSSHNSTHHNIKAPSMTNHFYSTTTKDKDPSPFDLPDLGPTQTRNTMFGFLNLNTGEMEGFEDFQVATTAADYDGEFVKRLVELVPAYRALDYLSHHLDSYLQSHTDGTEFVHHIEYVIQPMLHHPVYIKLIEDWLKTQKDIMLSQNRQQRFAFLEKAYQEACAYSPSGPLSVTINPLALGEEMGLDRATVTRIVTELVQDKHLTSFLGMKSIMVTRDGVRYLEGEGEPKPSVQHNFHFAQGSNSNVATGTNSVQVTNTGQGAQLNVASGNQVTQSITGAQVASLQELIEQLKQAFAAEPLLAAQRDDIADQFQVIESQLQRPEPKKSILLRSFDSLKDLAKDGLGSIAGHAVFELLQQVPDLLGSMM